MEKIYVVGAGVQGQEGFSGRALELVKACQVLMGRAEHLALFPDFPGEKVLIDNNFSEIAEILKQSDRQTVVLASGDPLFRYRPPTVAQTSPLTSWNLRPTSAQYSTPSPPRSLGTTPSSPLKGAVSKVRSTVSWPTTRPRC
ncbi:MAG: hypothetical protein R2864_00495 [Syntrophotaleaceae bacterium]